MQLQKFQILLLFIFVPLLLFAQPPGYLGKRASISFTLSSMPAIKGPTQNNKGKDHFMEESDKLVGFNYEFEAGLSYVVGRYQSLSLKAGQYHTGAIMEARTIPIYPTGSSGTSYNLHTLFNRLNVRSIGIEYSKFKRGKGALAPVGKRFYYGLKRSFITNEIIDVASNYSRTVANQVPWHAPLDFEQSVAYNFLTLGWSNNQVFWDKILFSTGVRISLPISFRAYKYANDNSYELYPDYETAPNKAIFETAAFNRLWRHELLRVDISIGYLLF